MRKSSRLFEIIQILRLSRTPVTAAQIGARLEVTQRSIYRDIAALQAMRVPIEGERGIGYILRPGFTLPPLMFTDEEVEAITLGLALIERTGDRSLLNAAGTVTRKIAAALPPPLQQALSARSLHAWGAIAPIPPQIDLALLRQAIRDEVKLSLTYCDGQDRETQRIIWPLALIYLPQGPVIVAWCALRHALRNFRADRVKTCTATGDHFRGQGEGLRSQWIAGWQTGSGG